MAASLTRNVKLRLDPNGIRKLRLDGDLEPAKNGL
jgi:hypothetical protein